MPRAAYAVTVLALLAGCAGPLPSTRVNHVVLCWLKEPGNAEHRQRVLAESYAMKQIPGVLEVRGGLPVPSDRDIVDDSFDIAVSFSFASVADMNAYLQHPTHQKAAKEVLGPLARKIVVYDFIEGTKP
jgi:hypothetical protein